MLIMKPWVALKHSFNGGNSSVQLLDYEFRILSNKWDFIYDEKSSCNLQMMIIIKLFMFFLLFSF